MSINVSRLYTAPGLMDGEQLGVPAQNERSVAFARSLIYVGFSLISVGIDDRDRRPDTISAFKLQLTRNVEMQMRADEDGSVPQREGVSDGQLGISGIYETSTITYGPDERREEGQPGMIVALQTAQRYAASPHGGFSESMKGAAEDVYARFLELDERVEQGDYSSVLDQVPDEDDATLPSDKLDRVYSVTTTTRFGRHEQKVEDGGAVKLTGLDAASHEHWLRVGTISNLVMVTDTVFEPILGVQQQILRTHGKDLKIGRPEFKEADMDMQRRVTGPPGISGVIEYSLDL